MHEFKTNKHQRMGWGALNIPPPPYLVTGGEYPVCLLSIQGCALTKQSNYKLFIQQHFLYFLEFSQINKSVSIDIKPSKRRLYSVLLLRPLLPSDTAEQLSNLEIMRTKEFVSTTELTSLASLSGSFLFLIVFLFVMVFLALEESVRSSNLGKVSKIII